MQAEAKALPATDAQDERHAAGGQQHTQLRLATISELETAEPRRAVEILNQAAADVHVQAAGWAVVWQQSDGGDLTRLTEYGRAFTSAGGIESAVSALRRHQASPAVLEHTLHTARVLARDEHNRVEFGSSGGVEAVVAAMRSHGSSVTVQEHGCRAMCNLSYSDSNHEAITSSGGVEAVVAAMQFHSGCETVQEQGCAVLHNLALARGGKKVVSKGGAKQVAQAALRAHPGTRAAKDAGMLLKKL